MALPTKIVQIDGHRLSAHWNGAIQSTMRTVMVCVPMVTADGTDAGSYSVR